MSKEKATTKQLLKSCLTKKETILMIKIFDLVFLFSITCQSLDDNLYKTASYLQFFNTFSCSYLFMNTFICSWDVPWKSIFSWKVKRWMNTPKTWWAKVKPFQCYLQFFKVIANLDIEIYNAMQAFNTT